MRIKDRALDLDGKVLGGRESPPVLRVGGWAIGCVLLHVLFLYSLVTLLQLRLIGRDVQADRVPNR